MIAFLKLLIRLIGLLFVLCAAALGIAFVAVIVLGRGGDLLGQVWFDTHHASLNLSQAIIQRYVHPVLWDPGVVTLLGWPSWVALATAAIGSSIVGWALLAFGRRRRTLAFTTEV
jgi:hypothetical protein